MKRIWKQWIWPVIEKWWGWMSCAAFTLLSVISTVATNGGKWTTRGTAALAVVFGLVAAFQKWAEENRRANKAEQALSRLRESPRITSKEWQELAEKMQGTCRHIRADYRRDSQGSCDYWTITGGDRGLCEAWITKAGAMLLRSPQVALQLSDEVRTEVDHKMRWLKYMKEKGCFRYDMRGEETLSNGHLNVIQFWKTHDLPGDSAKLCIECSAIET